MADVEVIDVEAADQYEQEVKKEAPAQQEKKLTPSQALAAVRETRKKKKEFDASRLSKEETVTHQALVCQLSEFGESRIFGHALQSRGFKLVPSALRTQSIEALEQLKERVVIVCRAACQTESLEKLVMGTVAVAERIATHTPRINKRLKLKGLTELLSRSDEVASAIELCRLMGAGSVVQIPPHMQLIMAIMAAAVKVNAVNTMLEKRKAPAETKADDDSPPRKRARRKKSSDKKDKQ